MNKKIILLITLLTLSVLTLMGCGKDQSESKFDSLIEKAENNGDLYFTNVALDSSIGRYYAFNANGNWHLNEEQNGTSYAQYYEVDDIWYYVPANDQHYVTAENYDEYGQGLMTLESLQEYVYSTKSSVQVAIANTLNQYKTYVENVDPIENEQFYVYDLSGVVAGKTQLSVSKEGNTIIFTDDTTQVTITDEGVPAIEAPQE